jgi:integrase
MLECDWIQPYIYAVWLTVLTFIFRSLAVRDYDIRTIQELLGRKEVKTKMIYTHVLNRGGKGVKSPADDL